MTRFAMLPAAAVADENCRQQLLQEVFAGLGRAGINAAVLNGVDPQTGAIGRDVDVLLLRADLAATLRTAATAAATRGWTCAGRWLGMWMPHGAFQLVFRRLDSHGASALALDVLLTDGIVAGVLPAYSHQLLSQPVEYYGAVRISPAGNFLKSVFVQALAGQTKGIQRAESIERIPADVRRSLVIMLGEDFVQSYEYAARHGRLRTDWRRLRRRAQGAFARRHPKAAAVNLLKSGLRRSLGSRHHHVVTAAVVGPDGVGKTSTLAVTTAVLRELFVDVRARHWRPQLLPPLSLLLGRRDAMPGANGNAPRRSGGRFAALRAIYYCVDFVLGYWIRDRHSTSSEVPLNLYDRCALDMLVDPVRFGLPVSPRGTTRWLLTRFARPDVVIALRDEPQRIRRRKPELSLEEIDDQLRRWDALHEAGLVDHIIDVTDQPAEQVGRTVAALILASFAAAGPDDLRLSGRTA